MLAPVFLTLKTERKKSLDLSINEADKVVWVKIKKTKQNINQ